MRNNTLNEKDLWQSVYEQFNIPRVTLGPLSTTKIFQNPQWYPLALTRYKFLAKMIGPKKTILELGCEDGPGIPILAEQAHHYTANDSNSEYITFLNETWYEDKYHFNHSDPLKDSFTNIDALVCLDVHHKLSNKHFPLLKSKLQNEVSPHSLVIFGSSTQDPKTHALKELLNDTFHTILPFHMSGNTIQAGEEKNSNYTLYTCCYKRTKESL
jgi:2-polyprenyl-3-methyl-5-hydroxy-6-metoxy-1,4-benzoquinol methylase